MNGHTDAPPMDHPLDPDFPIPSIESPDHSSRRSSVQTNGSVFDDSDPGRDTTVETTAPPQSPTPRPMPPRRPLVRIAPRPLRMPHNPEPLQLLYSGTSDTVVPQRDVSSSLPSSESPPTSNGPFPRPPYSPGTIHQVRTNGGLPCASCCPSMPCAIAMHASIGSLAPTIPLPPDTVHQRDTVNRVLPSACPHYIPRTRGVHSSATAFPSTIPRPPDIYDPSRGTSNAEMPFVPCPRPIAFGQPSIYERQQGLIQSA